MKLKNRKRLWKAIIPFLGIGIVVIISFSIVEGYLRYEDTPEKVDLLVVLGGGIGERAIKAKELYDKERGSLIFLTGVKNLDEDPRARYLMDNGVDATNIFCESHSTSTLEEATNTLSLMREKGWKSAVIVSDPYHMRRVKYSFDAVSHNNNDSFKLLFIPCEAEWAVGRWWRYKKSMVYVPLEAFKLMYYRLRVFVIGFSG